MWVSSFFICNIYFHDKLGAALIRKTYFWPKNMCGGGVFWPEI